MQAQCSTIENIYSGLEAKITERNDGKYAVCLKDLDAGEYLPTIKIFPCYEKAHEYASMLIAD